MQGAEGQPIAARPGGGLVPRALGALALRRGGLLLPSVAESGRGRAGASARSRADGPAALPAEGRAAGGLPGHLPRHAKRLQINERENRRRAPEDALLVQYAGPETAGTNAPQTMRVWPGLRLVGAGGKVQKGVFVTVSEVGERVALESGQSFEPRELLKHTRLCSAITYASVQGLTLRNRVWLCDVDSPHFTMKHLYMGCSRATSSELLSVL